MTGPASFTTDDDPGVLVEGFEVAGTTGRPWHPSWYAAHLEAAGLARADEHRTWRLPPAELGAASGATAPLSTRSSTAVAGVAGRFADPRLVMPEIEAVPDLTPARGSAIALARRAKKREWQGCTIVRIEGDASRLVPRLQAAASAAGYEWIVSPWSPDATQPPETVPARFTTDL
jgi:hypothetical protein